jgi:hypothetical protein
VIFSTDNNGLSTTTNSFVLASTASLAAIPLRNFDYTVIVVGEEDIVNLLVSSYPIDIKVLKTVSIVLVVGLHSVS